MDLENEKAVLKVYGGQELTLLGSGLLCLSQSRTEGVHCALSLPLLTSGILTDIDIKFGIWQNLYMLNSKMTFNFDF